LQHTIAAVDEQFEAYEFAKVCDTLFHFAWDDVCDWYLELSKTAPSPRVLGHVLDQLLRLLHPIIPFVTDELWSALTGGDSVMVREWPTVDRALIDDAAETSVEALQRVVTEVRRFRSDQGLKPGQRVAAAVTGFAEHEALVRSLARLDAPGDGFTATATLNVAGGVTVALDTRGTIDVAAERARLTKDRAAADKEITQATAKLGNEGFLAKAPAEVVAKLRDRLAAAEADIERIDEALARL
jgi:valyl-tRNA synthetase